MKQKIKNRLENHLLGTSLQRQILIPFLTIIILAGAITTFVSYKFSEFMVTDELIMSVEEQMVSVNGSFSIFLGSTEKIVNRFATKPELQNPREHLEEVLVAFSETKNAHPEILDIYMGMEDTGEMIIDPSIELPAGFDARTRPWYQMAVEQQGELIWTEPYLDVSTNELTVSAAKTISVEGNVVGVMSVDIILDSLVELLSNVKIGHTGYAALFDSHGTYIVHPTLVGEDVSDEKYYQDIINSGHDRGIIHYDFQGQSKAMGFIKNETTDWILIGTITKEEFAQKARGIIVPIAITLILVIGLAVLFSLFIAKGILKPIRSLQDSMVRISNGDLTTKVELNRKDELGQLSISFSVMIENIRDMLVKVASVSTQVTDASQTLVASAEENTAASNEVATTMEQIASGASKQSDLSEENGRTIQLLAGNIQHVESQTLQILEESTVMYNTSEAGMAKVQLLQNQFERTNGMINEMVEAITNLDHRSQDINEIVHTITAIASQTNLLALNAAIEAARAGEHGRGFAVVADEVRKLAEQSETALKQIGDIIKQMQGETKHTVQLIGQTSEVMIDQGEAVKETNLAFRSIKEKVEANSKLIMEISASINEMVQQRDLIIQNASDITAISQDTAAGTQEVTASIEETTASMEQLNELAFELESYSRELFEELQKFVIDKK